MVTSRWQQEDVPRGEDYDARFERLAAGGHDVHGEASFVMAFEPATVLDAGCGTGRVAIELSRRGVAVAGVDLDMSMLTVAQRKSPSLEWFHGDLVDLEMVDDAGERRMFDLIVAAGNVMIFLHPGTEPNVVASLAAHLTDGGHLVAGFQLSGGRYDLAAYDRDCAAAGLELVERYSSWTRDTWSTDSGYAVSVHRSVTGSDPDTTGS